MPHVLKHQYKFKCQELACCRIIQSDKWNQHCKVDHGYKLSRGGEIKKTTIQIKDGSGAWKAFIEVLSGLSTV